MSTLTTVQVSCQANRPDGSPMAGALFRFLLSHADVDGGIVVPREITGTADINGHAVIALWPNSLGANGTSYRVFVVDPNGPIVLLGNAVVPIVDCALIGIIGLVEPVTIDAATFAMLSAQTSAAEALVSQNASDADRVQTGLDRVATSAARVAADTDVLLTHADAVSTHADRSQTSLDRIAASASESAAASSATTAATQAGIATTKSVEAATSASTATTKAAEAVVSATNAATSESNAASSASSASTSATGASLSASTATTQAGIATTKATESTASAATATTKASEASTSATQAASSATSAAAIVTGVASNRPSVRPSLLLDFANTKQLDSRITFTRASTGTNYDNDTVAKAEENLFTYSQDFDNAAWIILGVSKSANVTTAPDGTTTADSITASTATNTHVIYQPSASVTGTARVASFYIKANTYGFVQILFGTDILAYANFDIGTGVLGTVGARATASITDAGNGWYRCSVYTAGSTANNSVYVAFVSSATAVRNESWTPAGTESIYLWGAQLEQRSTVTDYTPTTSAPITNYIPVLLTAASGVPRFDHNPITGESLGFLVEEQRTNLLTYSSDLDNAAWSKSAAAITTNAAIAPDGTLSADKLVDTAVSAEHFAQNLFTATSGLAHTFSVFAKAGGKQWLILRTFGAFADTSAFFDLQNGVTGAVGAGVTSHITPVGNGWYRCAATFTATSTATAAFRCQLAGGNSVNSYTGDGFSGAFIWGAQAEAGAFATSYVPTVAAQVTRSADSASMTGVNFSSWYRQDEGSFYSEVVANNYAPAGAQVRRFINLSDGSINNSVMFGRGATTAIRFLQIFGGVAQTLIPSSAIAFGTIASGGADKFAYGYSAAVPSLVLGGTKALDITSGFLPVSGMTQINIGSSTAPGTTDVLNGTIKRLAYYPKRISNTELQGVTA